jgi:phosphohistidine phosphatase
MKTLLVMRHAKSSWDDERLADHDRPLNQRGLKASKRMGRLLRDENLVPNLIMSSSALRAMATSERVAEACGYEKPIMKRPELYLAEPAGYVQTLHGLEASLDRVLVMGHNPGLEQLVETLTGKALRMPTAAIAQLSLPLTSWTELELGVVAKLVRRFRPKDLTVT